MNGEEGSQWVVVNPLSAPNKVDPSPSMGEAGGEGDTSGPNGWPG
jgi:hypothetical protein